MEQLQISSFPILLMVILILTFISAFTALDLLTMFVNSGRNRKLFIFASSISAGTAIWTFNFFSIIALEQSGDTIFSILVGILTLVTAIILTGIGFFCVTSKNISFIHICQASLLFSMAQMAVYLSCMYVINDRLTVNIFLLIGTSFLTLFLFMVSLLILFYAQRFRKENLFWLKPISAIIFTCAVIWSHLTSEAVILPTGQTGESVPDYMPIVSNLVFFVAVFIIGGLVFASMTNSKLLESRDKDVRDFQYALDQSSIVAITDDKGIITYANDKFIEISKYSREELIGSSHSLVNSGYHSKAFFAELWKTIVSGETWKGEMRNRAKDGSYYWVDATIVPFLDKQGKLYQFLTIRNDISEKKRTEEMLHHQDKLAAVGQMAAGIAHEIRNPLTSLKGYAEFLQMDEKDPERQEYFDIISDEIERINSIVEEFMMLAKPNAVLLKNQNILEIITKVLSLVEPDAIKRNIQLHFEATIDKLIVAADENKLKQVLLNFIKNGMEAMNLGGDLFVSVSLQNENAIISIRDTGVGIPEEQLERIGQPFFTTKKLGNGLGLMVSFTIIESHHGSVQIESEVNKGTTFQIILPQAKQ
jgi:PAS domain S-box-containing protein